MKDNQKEYLKKLEQRIAELEQALKNCSTTEETLKRERAYYEELLGNLSKDIERYRQFFEEDLAGIFITRPNGTLEECNPACAHIFGFDSVDDMKKVNLSTLYAHPEKRGDFLQLLRQEGKLTQWEMELCRKDGSKINVIGNVVGEFTGTGHLTRIKGYLFDITERKKLEGQFLHSQKMEAVGRLAGSLAHDFNNLLTVITSYADLVMLHSPQGKSIYKYAEEIRKASDRAAWLAKQLLTFSHRQAFNPRVIDLNKVIGRLEEMLRRLLGQDIKLDVITAEKLGSIRVDAGQIEQIVMNLAVNAKDAMPDGGRFTIETGHVTVSATPIKDYADMQPGPYALVAVTDTGCGMDETIKDQIFEPFFTTKDKGKGTGLGLSTVYGIMKQSKGYIHVYSEAGIGTTFRLYFPRVDDVPAEEQAAQTAPALSELHGSETVLIVENENAVRGLCREVLELMGYTILEAQDAQDALQVFKDHQEQIDLLLTDMIMPLENGSTLAEALQSQKPEMNVLYMSGYTKSFFAHEKTPGETFEFLSKPFTADELACKVREVLDKKKQ